MSRVSARQRERELQHQPAAVAVAHLQLGVVAASTAFLLWSLGWLRQGGWARALGAAGLVAGIVPTALLVSGAIGMNLAGAMLVYGIQAGWIALAGLYVWSGGLAGEASDADRGL